jgi:hypothetical protein
MSDVDPDQARARCAEPVAQQAGSTGHSCRGQGGAAGRDPPLLSGGPPPSPGSHQVPPPTVYTVIGTGLAGDESMLVRVEQYAHADDTIGPTPVVSLVACRAR